MGPHRRLGKALVMRVHYIGFSFGATLVWGEVNRDEPRLFPFSNRVPAECMTQVSRVPELNDLLTRRPVYTLGTTSRPLTGNGRSHHCKGLNGYRVLKGIPGTKRVLWWMNDNPTDHSTATSQLGKLLQRKFLGLKRRPNVDFLALFIVIDPYSSQHVLGVH